MNAESNKINKNILQLCLSESNIIPIIIQTMLHIF